MEQIQKGFFTTAGVVVAVLLGLFIAKVFGLNVPVLNKSEFQSMQFSVTGEGKVEVKPDVANVSGGVTVQKAQNNNAAQDELKKKHNDMVVAIKALGIKEEDIKTENYNVYPDYSYEVMPMNGTANNIKPQTYSGSVNITVKVRNSDKNNDLVGKVQQAMQNFGANTFQGISYDIDDESVYKEQARSLAIADAKMQAKKLEKDLGITFGKLVNFIEMDNGVYPMYDKAMTMSTANAAGGSTEQINAQSGTKTITIKVQLMYENK